MANPTKTSATAAQEVYIVDGARTPFIKAQGKPNPWSAADLAVAACAPLLARQPFLPNEIEEVIAGCVAQTSDEANVGRIIALRIGCGNHVMGWTVHRNCASGLQAIDCGFEDIRSGRHDLILVGGVDALSRTPLLLQPDLVNWLADFRTQKDWLKKLKLLIKLRPHFFVPVISLLQGLTDPIVNLTMGQTAENLSYQFNISRYEMDEYSVLSHQRASQYINELSEVSPLFDWRGNVYRTDNGVRMDTSIEKLAALKPVFDKPFGNITAGNSSQVSDGAAFLILANRKTVEHYNLPILGRVIDTAWAALNPAIMGLGPVHAIHRLLMKQQLSLKDIDYWEINEAFAAQVLACLKAMEDEHYCKTELGLEKPLGKIPLDKLNVEGGAIAVGHPVGASGARLVLQLLHILKRHKAKRGIASLCIGGGQGGAMLLERVD